MDEKYYIGIDGGGTKTEFLLADCHGKTLASFQCTGSSYLMIGVQGVIDLLTEGIHRLLEKAGIYQEDLAACCMGIPCFGESKRADEELREGLTKALTPAKVILVNDVEVGAAGSLGNQEGIHIIAGTGSIAFAKGRDGTRRCGGWNEFFSDEGSCYWIGRAAMEVFSKEADGRKPKGALYEVVREQFKLEDDYEFINKVVDTIVPYRDKVAAFQRIAAQAAQAGDEAVRELYAEAAKELAEMIFTLRDQLAFSKEDIPVSYFGGLFKTGDLILKPLKEILEPEGLFLRPPLMSAVEGALCIARQSV